MKAHSLVIGNGESRKVVNINEIDAIKIGCNAIYRDFKVDHLVCVDRRIVNEVISNKTNLNTKIYTRKDWLHYFYTFKNIIEVPELPYIGTERWDEPFQWGSGPYAVLIGALESNEVHIIGFDLYSKNKLVNNVYKDTSNYDTSDKHSVDPRYWIHQIGMVFKCFPDHKFVIYQEDNWVLPESWKYFNVSLDKISNISYNN